MSSKVISQKEDLEQLNILIRAWILEMSTKAGSGHPTSSMSAVELMTTLFFSEDGYFRYDINDPENKNNDRLIFSKGHASPLYYALWAAAGAIASEELMEFRKFGSRLEGHPTRTFPFTEVPTGSLGQGLGVGMGMALVSKQLDHSESKTYVLLGDSECSEGSVWEAVQLAAHYKLGNLVAIVDMNRLGQRGETMLGHDGESYVKRFEAFGWNVLYVDGHDMEAISQVYKMAQVNEDVPTCIIAKTFKGKGVSFLEDKDDWHGKALNDDELVKALHELGDIDRSVRGNLEKPKHVELSEEKLVEKVSHKETSHLHFELGDMAAARKVYGKALIDIAHEQDIVVLDAEVSNSTYARDITSVYPERFFEMFIAEQNMVSAAVGMARRGKLPFVSTFGGFLGRAFDQIRMAQYANVDMVIVGTHVGVSIGEDGSSQMGLEDMALFRSLLHATVLYPSDARSMVELLKISAKNKGITYVRTTRAQTPVVYADDVEFKIGGSHVLRYSDEDQVTLVTAGVTLSEAMKAAQEFEGDGIQVRVIDLYSIKPVDVETLKRAAEETKAILTIEDHYPEGGIGAAVREALASARVSIHSLAVTKTPMSGKPEELLAYEEIDAMSIVKKLKEILSKRTDLG